jgi:hypothetical protein
MLIKKISREQTQRRNPSWATKIGLIVSSLVFLGTANNSSSLEIYRCGSAYSHTAQCAQKSATAIDIHTEPRHAASSNHLSVADAQRQADALEKKRLQTERQATHNLPPRVVVTPAAPQQEQASQTAPQTLRHRQPHSPYFTAKNPNQAAKTTHKD